MRKLARGGVAPFVTGEAAPARGSSMTTRPKYSERRLTGRQWGSAGSSIAWPGGTAGVGVRRGAGVAQRGADKATVGAGVPRAEFGAGVPRAEFSAGVPRAEEGGAGEGAVLDRPAPS